MVQLPFSIIDNFHFGGDAVDFVRRFYNKDYAEAVEMLLNGNGGQIITSPPIKRERKPFDLPPRNDRMSRVFSYLLLTRGIDKDVIYEFVRRKMIYESADYHNAVFVGYDSSGKPRHAHKRGTVTSNPYKGNVAGSQPEFSFRKGPALREITVRCHHDDNSVPQFTEFLPG